MVNAILTDMPRGCAETQKRCSNWRHARSSTPPGFILEPPAERRIHAQMKRIGAPTGCGRGVFCGKWRFVYAGPSVWAGELSTFPVAVLQYVHRQAPVTLRARNILCASMRLCISVRLCGGGSLCALPHLPPARRAVPPLRSHPLKEPLQTIQRGRTRKSLLMVNANANLVYMHTIPLSMPRGPRDGESNVNF